MIKKFLLALSFVLYTTSVCFATDTISSTVTGTNTITVDKAPPTAMAPGVIINNSDVCKSGVSGAVQTQILGIATGLTIQDETCEIIKLSRSLYGMGMKVAAVSALCQDVRVFDAMIMAGTPCPYKGLIGTDALKAWQENTKDVPVGSKMIVAETKSTQLTGRWAAKPGDFEYLNNRRD
jgi:hypothetical protein